MWLNGSVWLNGLVVSVLGIRARGPGFDFRAVPLFHSVATMGKLFTHIAPRHFLSSRKLGYKKGVTSQQRWYWTLLI